MAVADKIFGSLFEAPTSDVSLPKDLSLPDVPARKPDAIDATKTEAPKAQAPARWLPPDDIRPIFEAAAREFDVPVNVLMALGHQESRYNANAVGPTTKWGRAKGMMQYLDSTASGLGINPFDPAEAIPAAAKQLAERLKKGYSMEDAVKEHFAGPDRKLWGEKTDAYGREVMEKVGKIGELLGTGASVPAQQTAKQDDEPGRYVPLTPEQVAQFEAGQNPFADTAPAKEKPRNRTWAEVASDTGVQLAEGVNTIAGAIPSLVAPEGKVAGFFKENADYWREQQSDPLKSKIEQADAAITKAGEDGVIAQISEAAGQYFTDPALAARFITTNLPSMIPGVAAAKVAHAAALARGATAAKAAATAATAAGASNAVLNAGGARGEAFDDIKKTLISKGVDPKVAEEQAIADSRVVAAIGGAAGYISGKTGLEKALTAGGGAGGAIRRAATAGGVELAGEQLEEVSPKLATNYQASEYDQRSLGKDVGRTIVETGIGAGPGAVIAGGAAAMSGRNAQSAGQVETAPVEPAAQQPAQPEPTVTVEPPAPSKAAGPLTRAVENAAAQPERVTVTAPEGQITGFVQSHTEDSNGNSVTRVLGDDGQVYTFTSQDGVQITPEAGPLTSAVEKVADERAKANPLNPGPAIWRNADHDLPIEVVGIEPQPGNDGRIYARVRRNGLESFVPADEIQQAASPAEQAPPQAEMGIPVQEQNQAVADVSITNEGETKAAEQNSDVPSAQTETAPAQAEASQQPGPIDLTGRTDQQLATIAESGNTPEKRAVAAAEIERRKQAAPAPRLEDMDEPALRARMKYIAGQAKTNGGWNSMLTKARKEVEREINRRQETASDQGTDTAAVRVRDERAPGAEVPAQTQGDQQGAGAAGSATGGEQRAVSVQPEPGNGTAVPGAGAAADAKPALTNEYAGKWFGSKEKADAFIAKKKAGATHEVVQTGKVRFEVKPKQADQNQIKKTEDAMPSVENGYVRLYRGQPKGDFPPSVDWVEGSGPSEKGRWFSTNIEDAKFYGKNGVIRYVDVPADVANASAAEGMLSKSGRLLPSEWANKAKDFAIESAQAEAAPAGAQQQTEGADNGMQEGRRQEEVANKQSAEPDWIGELFAGTENTPAPAAKANTKIDMTGLVGTLRAFSQKKLDEANDWASRQYKQNKTKINFEGDGPNRNESMSISSANESRRNRTVDAFQNQAQMASNLANRIERGFDVQAEIEQAIRNADSDIQRDGKPRFGGTRETQIEAYISNAMLGDANYGYGEGTVANLIRKAYEQPSTVNATNQAETNEAQAEAKPSPAKHSSEVVRTYKTKSGKIGAVVKRKTDSDGRVYFSYTGEWGAGSINEADMAKVEAGWKRDKRGFTIEENQAGSKAPVKTGDALADYWANSASASIENDVKAGRSKVVDLTGEKPTDPTPPKGGKKPDPFANNKVFTADKVEAARARLRSKLTQLNSGIDPELMMDGMTIAGAYIEAGVRNFADYAKAMTDDFGDTIKPYLLSFYEAARNYPGIDTDGMTPVDEAKAAHSALLTPAVIEQVKEAVGTQAEKPAKRTKKTGAKSDISLTQDWGVDHVDGYGDSEREDGNSVKDAFLKETRAYLNAVAGVLTEQGYMPQKDGKGRDMKPVSVNESGVATSGDVSLTMYHPDGGGIYVSIGGGSLRGVVPTTASGIAILFRQASEQDKYGTKSTNRWAPVDLSAADFAILADQEAKRARLAKPAASPTMEVKEPKQNDTEPTQADAGTGAEGQAAGPVRANEGGRDAGGNAEPAGGERGAGARGDARGAGERPEVPGDQRPAAEGAGSQHPAESGRGSGAEPGDRGNRKPRSSVANYRIQPGELKREGSWRATAERNVQIVELVKQIESEGRQPTADERALMAKFTGWGASEIANGIFPDQYGRYKNADWQALGQRLKAALTDEEYSQAKRTTQYAHYTSEGIIRGIWGAFQRLGFAGGSFVEPGMGIGHFNGLMPDGIAANSTYTGIEYDTLTGMIAKALYPASNVIVGDYTRTNLPKDFFDAAVGNPPFSQTQVLNDPEYKNRRPMLHDYFFMKTIDRVKPGGLLVFVTSKGTMDKTSDKSRKYLGERANLLGAIRLPQTAFKDNAGTEVVTDVIFLQKRGDGIEDNGVAWMGTKEVQTPQGQTAINEYFADHPEMVLGTHALAGSMYRANEYTVLPMEGDIEAHFAEAVRKLPENVTKPSRGSAAERAVVQDRDFNPKHKKEGGLYLSDDGKLMQVESGSGVELEHRAGADGKRIALTPKQKKWLKGYIGVRDALKQAQFDQLNDGPWEKSLKALNKAYDAFVKENGPILDYTVIERTNEDGTVTETKRLKNAPLFQTDVEGALVYALETIKEDGTIEKGAALRERVLERHRDPEIKTTQDAMFVSLNRLGSLDLDDVAALAGTDRETIVRDLGTAIYDAPGKGWQLADEYLSGNVVRKLKEAQAAAEINPAYKRNVEALLAVQPRPLGPTEITVRLGANWVPASDVAAFAADVLGDRMDITYSPVVGRWSVDQKSRSVSEWAFDKMSAGEILESLLNSRQIKVTFRDSEGKTHVDVEATEKANDIAAKMRERFRTWIWADTKRADRLVKFYNENFNNIAPRSFDGSHLTLPGVSARFKLYPHQKRAVWRIIQQGDVYLAHAVGAGKTMEMIAAGMEERRLGLVNKPMYVVPNHMLAQFSREFLELYPAANIMVADENNFHTHNRKRFVAQAALNNPDAIIITHSAFGRIAMSDEFSAKFIQDQIDAWKEALDDVDKSDRITVKQIERRIEQLERRLEGKQGKDKKDQVLTFEELGVDKLYVDEFHEFRKLDFATNQGSVKGIDPNGSQRALDLQMKTEYLRGKKPGRALVAASGTPVTNTMGELFTAQRFFQPEQLREDGLDTFDAWSAQYGDIVTGFEQNAAGGYEMVSRFAKFQNVPELMRRVRSFMDILTSSNLGELVKRPDVIGGGREVVVTPIPDGYKEYQQELQARIQRIRNRKGPPKKGEDIILNVIADGRFSAIDMRFVDPTLPGDPNSKLNLWIDDIIAAYKETADYEFANKATGKPDPIKGASIIGFSDIGLGEASAANRGFDMRAWIEKRLADAGIPKEHVAFMRDHKQSAKKERLFADMREGKRRVLIGGKEMETGTNVQKRLTHLFHLDAPWFPASVEQREGRIIRQGNQNQKVKINAYATKGSYDSTMWGMNARKARFIEQAMNGDDTVRSLEDVSEASAFEMAAALASGDERYLKLAGLKTEVERLERLRHAHYQDQNSLRRDKHWSEDIIVRSEAKAKELKEAIAKRIPIRPGEFAGKVGKATFDSREEFSQAVFKAFKKLADANHVGDKAIAEIGGFDVVFYGAEMKGSGEYVASLHVSIPGDPDALASFPIDPEFAVAGIATRAANQVNGMDRELATAETRITEAKRKIEQINARLGATFPEEAILLEKVAELSALEEELSAESEAANADAAAATVETEGEQQAEDTGEEPRYSVAPDGNTVAEFGPVHTEYKNDPAGAIERLMTDKAGEAIIDHPQLGEISLIYSEEGAGLQHIAERRGAEFMQRLPDLLKNVVLFSKTNQKGRVFIGNDRDEAVVRLDWNGEAKTWLLSAYEKYPDLNKAGEVQQSRRSQTVEQRTDKPMTKSELRQSITRGAIGSVVARMIDAGVIQLHDTAKTLPKEVGKNVRGVQAVTMPDGTIHMVANTLTRENARGVLLHEMFHRGGEGTIGSEQWSGLMGRMGSLYRQSEQSTGKAREFFDRARVRVAAAKKQGAVATRMEVEEFAAYAIEEYERAPESLPAAIRKWVEDFIGYIKATLVKIAGKQIGQVTPAELAAFAKFALMDVAIARSHEIYGRPAPFAKSETQEIDSIRYSVAPEQADAMLAEATDALQAKDDFIGGVVGDLGMAAKAVLHPRQIAAIFPQFTPVYRTGVSQIETRDAHVAELGKGMGAYDALPQESKEKVNKVLELGRLMSQVYSEQDLADGVANTGSRTVVALDEKGKPTTTSVPVEAVLTGKGEVVQLSAEEIKAYNDLRVMFDRALDMMRDQTLEDMGYGQFAGQPNAAKAIMGTITKATPPEQAERIANVAKYVAEIEQAKRAGYVPFARYGDYVVTVKEKIADVSFVEDDTEHLIAQGLPDSFAGDMLDLGAEKTKEGWRIKKSQKKDVERLTEKTVYSAKIETGLRDMLDERKAGSVEDIKVVKDAIEAARKEWVGDNPARRIVAFKTKDQIADGPVNLTDVAALAELSSIDNATWDMVHEKLVDAQKARGFRRHLIHSDNVPGYTGDFERAMADYVISMAGYLSRRQHMKRWENSVSSITEQPRLHKYATAYRDYLNNPQEELAMVRQIGFFAYIAGVPMSAFANLTQVPMMTVPTLAQVAPMPLVMKEVGKAYIDALKMVSLGLDMFSPDKAPADVRQALKEAWDEGSFVPLETYDLMMTARQRNVGARKGVKAFNNATQVISMTFTFAERLNRLVTFMAAARLSEKRAVQENARRVLGKDALARAEVLRNWTPKNFAEWVVDESQYRMGKANRPTIMRGVGSAIMQFKGFMLQTFEAWYRMTALHGKDGKVAAAASIATLYAFAGIWGLPGADDLRKLLENIYKQITDKDLDMKTELRGYIARVSGSNAIAQIVNKGVTYPLGLDMTRVGMGSVVPDSPLAAAGIPFDMLIGRPKRAFEKATVGDYWSAAGELTPNFMKHPLVAAGWASDGVRDKQGNRILTPQELSKADIAMKALGSQPSIVTDIRDYEYAQRRQETAVDALKRSFANKIAKTIGEMETTTDAEKLKKLDERLGDLYAKIDEHNATASPEQIIKIDQRSLRNKIMRETEGVKSTWGKERKAARGAAEELRGTFGLQEEEE